MRRFSLIAGLLLLLVSSPLAFSDITLNVDGRSLATSVTRDMQTDLETDTPGWDFELWESAIYAELGAKCQLVSKAFQVSDFGFVDEYPYWWGGGGVWGAGDGCLGHTCSSEGVSRYFIKFTLSQKHSYRLRGSLSIVNHTEWSASTVVVLRHSPHGAVIRYGVLTGPPDLGGLPFDWHGQLQDGAYELELVAAQETWACRADAGSHWVFEMWFGPGNCGADFNGDGQVDFFDYLDFLDAFANQDQSADFNGDGQVDFFDMLDFMAAYAEGC